ncbi:hypothetical protein, partial [Streptococcus suis]|uniref:hypothetical protein n=1 Tax=Streptococcus suis TaxID=1307 RepID=UPI001C0C4695
FIAQFHKNSTPNVRFFLSNFWGAVHHQAVSSLLYRHLVFLLLLRRAGSGKELDWSKKEFVNNFSF